MAIMPGAVWRPIPASTSRISSYDITCIHTMVGSLAGTDGYFRKIAPGVNSHFGTGGDGTIYQWVDTAFRSGANLNGNYHIISIENADMGPEFAPWNTGDGNAVPAFTLAQIEANAKILAWAHETHGIPLGLIPDSKPGRRGTGYHRLGVPGYMVAGGEQWSSSTGKVCPGPRRVAQVPQIINRATQIAGGSTSGEDMTYGPVERDELVIRLDEIRSRLNDVTARLANFDSLYVGVMDSTAGVREILLEHVNQSSELSDEDVQRVAEAVAAELAKPPATA